MPIGDCCKLDVVCCEAEASIAEVAALMREHHVGDVIVVGAGDSARIPLGIVTDRDIVIEAVAPQVDLNLLTAGDIMHAPLTTIRDCDSFAEALRTMRALQVRRMPVVREDGTLHGIVTAGDIINILVSELSTITGVIMEQPAAERRSRP